MNTDEIKELLETTATVMETGIKQFPADLSRHIVSYINSMPPQNASVLAVLFGVTAEKVREDLQQIVEVLGTMDKLFAQGNAQQIADFARSLENRPVILKFISWNL